MKRLALLGLLGALLLSSCAGATVRYSPGRFRMTAPAFDNFQVDSAGIPRCARPELCYAVPAATVRIYHLRITQGAYAWEDSTAAAGAEVTWDPPDVPLPGLCTAAGWASDPGGSSCPVTITRTPLAIRRPPAAPTLVAY